MKNLENIFLIIYHISCKDSNPLDSSILIAAKVPLSQKERCRCERHLWWVSEESNLTGSPFMFSAAHYALLSQGILLQHPAPPVGTIPRTHIIPTQINTITFFPFISNLISIPFLNFLATVKDNVESNHNRPQIKDNILFSNISRLSQAE